MGFRFQKRFSILPGVRINLSKGGLSTSLGPKGADINIGKKGVTTSAGIPGTGLSWRQKLGGRGSGIGILTVLAGLALWGFSHFSKIEKMVAAHMPAANSQPAAAAQNSATAAQPAGQSQARQAVRKAADAAIPGPRYVRRDGSVLRDEAKASGKTLKKESKGAMVTLTAIDADGWAAVTDGNITGYMRASVLSPDKP